MNPPVDPTFVASREFEALAEAVVHRKDPELTIYLLLLKARLGSEPLLRRQQLFTTSKLTLSEFKRALRWLKEQKLISHLQGRREVYYFAKW